MYIQTTFISILILIAQLTFSQDYMSYNTNLLENEPTIREKVYVVTDRENYVVGDDIWFSVFVTDETLLPSTLSKIVYVELVDLATEVVLEQRSLEVLNGFTKGDFHLEEYQNYNELGIRAYTRYMLNFSEELFFQKTIQVLTTTDMEELKNESSKRLSRKKREAKEIEEQQLDVQFFPEGGNFIIGFGNKIAFKALDFFGEPIEISGNIINDQQKIVSPFTTLHAGMGLFSLFPSKNESYKAVFNYNGVEYIKELPTPTSEGISLQANLLENGVLAVKIESKSDDVKGKLYAFIRGKNVFQTSIQSSFEQFLINTDELPSGIMKLIFTTNDNNPLQERQVFIYPKTNSLKVDFDDELNTGSEISSQFKVLNNNIKQEGLFSLKMIDQRFIVDKQNTILTNLLLESDLTGTITAPGYYFDENIELKNRKYFLDLVMLTHGWANFKSKAKDELVYLPETFGFNRSFKLVKYKEYSTKEEPIVANLNISSFDPIISETVRSEDNGMVNINGIDIKDSILLFLKANYDEPYKVRKNGKLKTIYDLIEIKDEYASPQVYFNYPQYLQKKQDSTIQNLQSLLNEDWRIGATYNDILIEAVTVTAEKIEDERFENRGGYYGTPSNRVLAEDRPNPRYVSDFLYGIAGVNVSGTGFNATISIRGGGEPQFLLDGSPIDQEFALSLNAFDIDYVDVLKGPSAAIYGIRGGNGVIAIYTKRGSSNTINNQEEYKGLLTMTLPGYYNAREYYNPMFTGDEAKIKAYSPTLFWEPLITDEIKFQTPEFKGDYRMIIEGISQNGEPVYLEKDFAVY